MWVVLAPIVATHASILVSAASTVARATASQAYGTLSYHSPFAGKVRSFGGALESRKFSARGRLTGELLRFL